MKNTHIKRDRKDTDSFSGRSLNELGLLVADHVTAMLAYWDKNQICRFANHAYREWFGKTREEMVGKMSMKELLGPLYEKNLPYILAALEGKPQIFEREIPLPGGDRRHSIANYYPDIVDGEVRGFFVHVADITAIKQLELQLRASEIKFKSFLESAPDAVIIVDQTGIIQIINAQCKNLFGYTSEEICGQPAEVLLPERYREKHKHQRSLYFERPRPRPMGIGLKLYGLHKSGIEIPLEISLAPVETKDGTLIAASIRDVTWKVQKEKQLMHSMDIINNQNKQLLNFAYIVSHNLKSYSSNLASVLGLLVTAKSDQEKSEMIRFLNKISEGFSSTIANLNEIVEMQNKGSLELHKLNLHEYIQKCIDSLAIQIKNTSAVLNNFTDKNLVLVFNEAYLESIIQNLLTNAIKYRHPERTPIIQITSETISNYLVLHVKDNGKGMDLKKYGSKLFGMYKTFHGNPDAKGIGLFITKYQIEALGGKIEVQSQEEVGTTFSIYFPYSNKPN